MSTHTESSHATSLENDEAGVLVGRAEELEDVARYLRRPKRVPMLFIVGMAGIGKSSFARHVAAIYAPEFPDFSYVLTTNVGGPQATESSIVLLESILGVRSSDQVGSKGRAARLRSVLRRRKGIIVVENIEDAAWLFDLMDEQSQSLVVATSRQRIGQSKGCLTVRLGPLSSSASLELFEIRLGRNLQGKDRSDAVDLMRRMDGHPLALAVAAGMVAGGKSIEDLTQRLRAPSVDWPEYHSLLSLSIRELGREEVAVLRVLSKIPTSSAPADLVSKITELSIGKTRRALRGLVKASLVLGYGRDSYRVHDLVKEDIRTEASSLGDPPAEEVVSRTLYWYRDEATLHARELESSDYLAQNRAIEWFGQQVDDLFHLATVAEAVGHPSVSRDLAVATRSFGLLRSAGSIALRAQELVVRTSRRSDNTQQLIEDLVQLADLLVTEGSSEEAQAVYREAAELGRSDSVRLEASVLYRMGAGLAKVSDYEGALTTLAAALAAADEVASSALIARILNNMARINLAIDRLPEAELLARRALETALSGNLSNEVADSQTVIGHIEAQQGRFEEASALLDEALVIYEENGNLDGRALVLQRLGSIAASLDALALAVYRFQSSLLAWQEAGNKYRQCEVQNALGAVLARMQLHRDSARSFNNAVALAREVGDRRLIAISLYNMAESFMRQGDFKQSRQSLLSAAEESVKARDFDTLCLILIRLGRTSAQTGRWNEALDAFQDAYPLAHKSDDQYRLLSVCDGLGASLTAMGQYEQAIHYYEVGLSRARQLTDGLSELKLLLGLTSTYASANLRADIAPLAHRALWLMQSLDADIEDESIFDDVDAWIELAARMSNAIDDSVFDKTSMR